MRRQLAQLSSRLESRDKCWAALLAEFGQPPADIAEFVTSPLYLDLAEQVYPEVLAALESIFDADDGLLPRYDEAVLCWGIGSGKSYLASLAILYMAHLVLCLRDPQRHFRLSPGSQIALVIMGPSSRQVRSVIFSDIQELVKRAPWFRNNYPPTSERQEALDFPKSLTIAAGNSTDTYVLGYNVLAAVIDEAAWLMETQDGRRQSAEDIYTSLQRRIKSRFGRDGLLLIVSSPKHTADFVESKLQEARTNPRIFASRKAVWEVKPPDRFSGTSFEHRGRRVPIEYYEEFQRDPHKAMRDLAALPQGAYHALFVDMEPLYRACDDGLRHPVVDEHLQLCDWFRCEGDSRPRYVHVDLGLRHDACAIAMAVADEATHLPPHGDTEQAGMPVLRAEEMAGRVTDPSPSSAFQSSHDHCARRCRLEGPHGSASVPPGAGALPSGPQRYAQQPHSSRSPGFQPEATITVELMTRFLPPPGGEVDLAHVREFILALRERGFNIAGVSYDGFQSADSRQILRRRGLHVKTISVDRDLSRYQMLKELAQEGRLRLYRYPPFFEEAAQLEVVREQRVDHPRGGSKDVTDAVAGAVSEALLSAATTPVHGHVL